MRGGAGSLHTWVTMLRGINVGGRKRVSMEELRACYLSLGFGKVLTYIQSGNVVFEDGSQDAQGLAERIEKGLEESFGLDVRVIIRPKEEMLKVIKNNPFKEREESRVHVTFLSALRVDIPMKEISAVKDKTEEFYISGREVYLFCPNGYGRTKLSNSFLERKLETYATTRNWRTVNALYALQSG